MHLKHVDGMCKQKKKPESITLNIKIYSTAFLMQSPAL